MIYSTGLLQSVLRHRASRVLAGFLSGTLVAVSTLMVPSFAVASQKAPPPPEVLVYPFTNGTGSAANDVLISQITGNVRLKINALGYYRSSGYSVLNPSLQRALNVENTLSFSELSAPTASPDRAQKIAALIGRPYYLVGNIDSITTDPTSGNVTVALDGTFYETDTGAVIKQANVTGVAASTSKDESPEAVQADAVDNASGQLVGAVVGPQFSKSPRPTTISRTNRRANLGAGILFIFAVALALVLINNHGHSSSSSSSANSGTTGGTTTGGTTGPPAPP